MEKRILIDPGHGGSDPGAVNSRRNEKDDTLRASLKIGQILKGAGYSVSYTRTSDKTLSLRGRSSLENKGEYDIFVSFHRDSFSNKSANGVTVFTYSGSNIKVAIDAAKKIVDGVAKAAQFTNRGIKKANFHVLRETKSPALLIECGFISNDSDNTKFDQYLDEICIAVAKGICDILGGSITNAKPNTDISEAKSSTNILYRVKVNGVQVGAYSNLDNAKKMADSKKGIVYDISGKAIYPIATTSTKVLYRVKVNGVQVGAYSNLDNAKKMADSKKGIVYDMSGKAIYPIATTSTKVLYRVKVNGVQVGAYANLDNAKEMADSKKGIVYDMSDKQVYPVISTVSGTDEKYRYSENGTFYPNTKIYFRNAPSVDSDNPIQGNYSNGESVKYDTVVIGERYTWISWVSSSTGKRRYMPIRDRKSGEPMWGRAV